MSRFNSLLDRFSQAIIPLSQTYIVDMGSVFTRVIVDGRIVFSEPTCLVVHTTSGSIIALGKKAAALRGKLPPALKLIEPVNRGRLQNITYSGLFLATVLDEGVHFRGQRTTLRREVVMTQPCDVTPGYTQALKKVCTKAGVIFKSGKNQPMAAYDWLTKQKIIPNQACILVIGGDVSEISFISHGQTVACHKILFGGNDLTKAIKQALKQTYQLEVGWETAELVKKELASLVRHEQKESAKHMVIKGKQIMENIPTTVKISTKTDDWEMAELCQRQFQTLVEGVQHFFQDLPPDLLTQILDKGIFVTGGTSQFKGLSSYLEHEFHTAINLSPTPDIDIVHGLYANTI